MSYVEQDLRVYAQYGLRLIDREWEGLSAWSRFWMAVDLLWRTQSFVAVVLLRLRGWMLRHHVPFAAQYLDKVLMASQNVFIGHYVEIGPGLYIAHGNVVIDGVVSIGARCVINPWVTIGLSGPPRHPDRPLHGPTIDDDVYIGTGAKVLGDIAIGEGAVIAANAVVLDDVPAYHLAVGAPARALPRRERRPFTAATFPVGDPKPTGLP
jgi:serine O-acetyltransferase